MVRPNPEPAEVNHARGQTARAFFNTLLGLITDPEPVVYPGHWTMPAANEPGSIVEAEVFRIDIDDDVHPAAEIEEITRVIPSSTSE